MTDNQHLIVYAAPAHAPPPTLECSCGWSASAEHEDGTSYRDVLNKLLAQWMSHIDQASASPT